MVRTDVFSMGFSTLNEIVLWYLSVGGSEYVLSLWRCGWVSDEKSLWSNIIIWLGSKIGTDYVIWLGEILGWIFR